MKSIFKKLMLFFYKYPVITHLIATIVGVFLTISYFYIISNEEKIMNKGEVTNHSVFIYFDKKIDELRRIKLKNEFRTKIFQNHFRITYTTQRDNLRNFVDNSGYEMMEYDELYKKVTYLLEETDIEIRKKQTQINIPELFLNRIDAFTNGSYKLFLDQVKDLFLNNDKKDKKYNNEKMVEFCNLVHKKWLKIDDALPYVLDNMNGAFKEHKVVFVDPETKKSYDDFN